MNALLSRPVLEHAVSMCLSATSSNSGRKKSCNRLSTGFFAECRSFLPVRVTDQRADQQVMHFPKLVSVFGGRTFNSYWSESGCTSKVTRTQARLPSNSKRACLGEGRSETTVVNAASVPTACELTGGRSNRRRRFGLLLDQGRHIFRELSQSREGRAEAVLQSSRRWLKLSIQPIEGF
jgi:hypothetical protein